MKVRIEMTLDDDGVIQVIGTGLTPETVASIFAAFAELGQVESEEYEEE